MPSTVYLIPTLLAANKTDCIPSYLLTAIQKCNALFVENERSARRYLKLMSKDIVIDNYTWYNMKEVTAEVSAAFIHHITSGDTIGIISEAGCPGIADPGQLLADIAHKKKAVVKPLVGPNSIVLSLMASGMNGQQFCFHGYLPIDSAERVKTIRKLEAESKQKNQTQIFIETPYRNHQLLDALTKTCAPATKICVAADLTDDKEYIKTATAEQWKKETPQLHKRPAVFLLYAGAE